MTLGVEFPSPPVTGGPRCPRILPCPCRSRPLPAMIWARRGRAWPSGDGRPGPVGGPGLAGQGLRRESLPESLLAGGAIAAAAAAEHCHRQERALNAEVTALCLVTGALFPMLGYDSVLALVFNMPGLPGQAARHPGADRPRLLQGAGAVRRGPGPGHVRVRRGPRTTSPRARTGPRSAWRSPRSTAPPWNCSATRCSRRSSASPPRARGRCCAWSGLLRWGTRRWKAAVIGRYLDGENALADGLQDAFGPGQLNLADRGFFSMDRWIRFSAAGADLLWRVIVSVTVSVRPYVQTCAR